MNAIAANSRKPTTVVIAYQEYVNACRMYDPDSGSEKITHAYSASEQGEHACDFASSLPSGSATSHIVPWKVPQTSKVFWCFQPKEVFSAEYGALG